PSADAPRGGGGGAHGRDAGGHAHVLGITPEPLAQQHAHEDRAGAAGGVDGHTPPVLEAAAVQERHRAYGAAAGDGDPGHDRVVALRVLDGGDEPEVDLARVQPGGDARRHVAHDLEPAVAPQPVHGGDGVEVADDAEAERPHHSFTT